MAIAKNEKDKLLPNKDFFLVKSIDVGHASVGGIDHSSDSKISIRYWEGTQARIEDINFNRCIRVVEVNEDGETVRVIKEDRA
jgi:hypothetical protein